MRTKIISFVFFASCFLYNSHVTAQTKIQGGNTDKTKKADSLITGVKDKAGKTYKTVKIGTQVWMAENLAYKVDSGCWAYNSDKNNAATYGYLYTWETAKNVCPAGWHLPSDAEWNTLTYHLGGDSVAGGKLKEADTLHWKVPNKNATNSSGFNGLPGAYRFFDGTFGGLGYNGSWWTSSEFDATTAWFHFMNYNSAKCIKANDNKKNAMSVRCLKD